MPPICAAPVAALRDSLQIKFIDGILVNAFVFEKHKHIDWKIGYFPFSLYIGVREDDCACEMIILILQYLDEGRVFLIILAAFDLDRQDSTIMFDNKI